MNSFYVYILTNKSRGTMCIGSTNNLQRRISEHSKGAVAGFTKQYRLSRLVYIEETPDITAAINREKQLKRWHRQWKLNLVETMNAKWEDLSQMWGMDTETSSV